jgi:nucleoside-diphosphate-sugar epimerase
MTKRICVTGASGRAGRFAVAELLSHDYEVVATDRVLPRHDLGTQFVVADLTDHGQALELMAGTDGVIHLANTPSATPAITFNANTAMNFNVFMAAAQAGLERVVWASSETTLGLPFDEPPHYAPVDEDHYPLPTSTYALSKVTGETMATHIAGWSGIPFAALRFSNILGPDDYQRFPSYWADPLLRKWNLWGYIDERDVATACRLGLEAAVEGSTSYIIAAADTVMNRPSADLLNEVFPGVPLKHDVGEFGSLLATDRAKEALGFTPQHSWRDHLES